MDGILWSDVYKRDVLVGNRQRRVLRAKEKEDFPAFQHLQRQETPTQCHVTMVTMDLSHQTSACSISFKKRANFLQKTEENPFYNLFMASMKTDLCDVIYVSVSPGCISSIFDPDVCSGLESFGDRSFRTFRTAQACLLSVFQLDPVSGPVEGGTVVTISGSNLGQRAQDVQSSVTVAGVPCSVILSRYEVSSR